VGRVVRGSVSQILRTAHQYLFYRDQEAQAKKLKAAAYDPRKQTALRDYVAANGEPNGDHRDWLFPEPFTIGTQTYLGLRNQASPSTFMDEEKAQELVVAKGLRARVVKEVTTEVWDYDELYVLNQQGVITDDEIDSLMVTDISHSLVVIK
jgi:hypothetical protein